MRRRSLPRPVYRSQGGTACWAMPRKKKPSLISETPLKKPSASCKNAYVTDAAGLTAFTTRAQMLKDPAGLYLTAASTADEKTGATLPQSPLVAELMRSKMFDAYLSQLKRACTSGTTLTKRSLFSYGFHHGGGAVGAYFLVDLPGNVIHSGVSPKYVR
jgi:hypothetical protein